MHISRIELENIKSHVSSTFDFPKGTTAITGENGAGKTTIIEAIAWVLFDVLDYKKDDFVRRGAKKGSVKVYFESGLDGRIYEVYRDSGTGYHVLDPRLRTRLANKRDEVVRFLWQHLGLEPGTDLGSLFKQAIGVPQGTFTAIFLATAVQRKIAFDRLLKVEEYREAAEKLRETSKFVDVSIGTVREQIARAEGELARSETAEQDLRALQEEIARLDEEMRTLATRIAARRELVSKLEEADRVANTVNTLRAEAKYALEKLASIEKAKVEIGTLRPKIADQERLEGDLTKLRDQLAATRAFSQQAASMKETIERLRADYAAQRDRVRDAEKRAEGAGQVKELEDRNTELVRLIAEQRAQLERDQRFQSEIEGGFCPILSEKCLNMKPGQTLESFLSTQFAETTSHITQLEQQRAEVNSRLDLSRAADRVAATLDDLRRREQELKAEGIKLAEQKKEIDAKASAAAEIEPALARIEAELKQLDDPRSRVRFLEGETAREAELRESMRVTEASIREAETRQAEISAALAANKHDGTEAERQSLHRDEKREVEINTILAAARTRAEQLEAELARFTALRGSLAGEFREKERLETVAEATKFIRDTLKEAAPRVARNYVYHVSVEANQLFREIIGDAGRSLKWAEDYSIVLEENGFERPFASLSGGEQMAAALAVRLGLLKQLTDIRIAFFDEPTANMDLERRENLAQQISRITNFDQLFVISHDETFDNYVDNVIEVRRG